MKVVIDNAGNLTAINVSPPPRHVQPKAWAEKIAKSNGIALTDGWDFYLEEGYHEDN